MTRVLIERGEKATEAWIWICKQEAKFVSYRNYLEDGTAKDLAFDVEDERIALELALRFA